MRSNSRCLRAVCALALLLAGAVSEPVNARELRVCADPNNLPFSHRDGSGFENRIVELIARELGASVSYTWWPQWRGMLRNTLEAGLCDVVPGIATDVDRLATTRPYYRSSYVFMTRRDSEWASIDSFDDARLRAALIGVQLVGDDGANPPPALALARRGLVANVRGFPVYGDHASAAPQRRIVDALASGALDVAVVWGPTAGWFAQRAAVPLQLSPVAQQEEDAPMAFAISMGVRRGDTDLLRELDQLLQRNAASIAQILDEAGVPRQVQSGTHGSRPLARSGEKKVDAAASSR